MPWSPVETYMSVREPAWASLPGGRAELRPVREVWDVQVERTGDFRPLTYWRVTATGRTTGCVIVASGGPLRSLGAARKRARQLAEVLGGRIVDGELVVEVEEVGACIAS